MVWTKDQVASSLSHTLSRLPHPPFRAAAFICDDTGDSIELRVYFDGNKTVIEDDLEEISIALTEFYSHTSSNSDVGEIKYAIAVFDAQRVQSDIARGYTMVTDWP